MMRLESLGAVHTHTGSVRNRNNQINKIEIRKRVLCQNVDRHN